MIENQNVLADMFKLGENGSIKRMYTTHKLSIIHGQDATNLLDEIVEKELSRVSDDRNRESSELVEPPAKHRRNGRQGSNIQWVRSRQKTNTILF